MRSQGEKPSEAQNGQTGHTLKRVVPTDRIETHTPVGHFDGCHCPLGPVVVVVTSEVLDLSMSDATVLAI